MPRTIEHILDCHKAAQSLRQAGKPILTFKANILSIIHEDQENESAEHVADVAIRIAKRLRASLPDKFFDLTYDDCSIGFLETVEAMESCTVDSLRLDDQNGYRPVDVLNDWLNEIYDWADHNRVWLGN